MPHLYGGGILRYGVNRMNRLGLAGAAQDIDELVADQLLDVGTGGLQVLTGIELVGMLGKELTDGAGHGQTLWLYEYGGDFVLDVMDEAETRGTHWHPMDVDSAAMGIAEFMEGRSDYELFPFPEQ